MTRTHPADERGNVIIGSGRVFDSDGNVVFEEDGRVVLFGARDLIVVRTSDTTLVMPRDRATDMKELLARMERDDG